MKFFNFKKIKKNLSLLHFFRLRGASQKKSISKTKCKTSQKAEDKNSDSLEEDLYSLDEYQLNNLLDKKVNFLFFSLDVFSKDALLPFSFQKVQVKAKEEILAELKNQDFKAPLVLICKNGDQSKAFSQTLRDKGFINCYYLKKGFSLDSK